VLPESVIFDPFLEEGDSVISVRHKVFSSAARWRPEKV
jgi:hypothetical protein